MHGTSKNAADNQSGMTLRKRLSAFRGLSAKLLWLTIIFIMLAEILIFVPSIANFRNTWLRAHLDIAEAASIVYLDSSDAMLSETASKRLLETVMSTTVAVRRDGQSQLIATSGAPSEIMEVINIDDATAFSSINSAIQMLFADPNSQYRVFGSTRSIDAEIEIVQPLKYIQNALWGYTRNILILSLLISVFAAGLVYLALYRLIVLPIIRISTNMDQFSKEPDNASLIFIPTGRDDEIGVAETRLAAFQHGLRNTLRQKQHLADLGLAVSKINHDLRNILASAQLFSDRLTSVPDPNVQRFAPKLIRAIDRAIGYTKSVLDYGRALEAPPDRRNLVLKSIGDDVAELLGFESDPEINWSNQIDPQMEINADPEQLFRVMLNLCRNAKQAIQDCDERETPKSLMVSAVAQSGEVHIRVKDTGPGIPSHVMEKLFNAFQASTKAGGTGLGMTIASELVRAHGGKITVEETSASGTTVLVCLPASNVKKGEPDKDYSPSP